jgi:hypothetical protein
MQLDGLLCFFEFDGHRPLEVAILVLVIAFALAPIASLAAAGKEGFRAAVHSPINEIGNVAEGGRATDQAAPDPAMSCLCCGRKPAANLEL